MIVQNSPGHPDNYGHIVTHAGMNLDERLREFKLFESDDQKFWEEVIGGKEPEPSANVTSGAARMRLSEQAVVNYEIVDTMIEEQFTSAEQEDIIKELREKLESLGLDPEQADAIVLSKTSTRTTSKAAAPYQVLPQRSSTRASRRQTTSWHVSPSSTRSSKTSTRSHASSGAQSSSRRPPPSSKAS